ncbi:hypothetical protein P8452_52388 [Trifolium repens]|nr:hypothetical protein P8452_52388 [Trifolium repens]
MTLLQAWIHHHFHTLFAHLEDQSYDETIPGANKYSLRSGELSISSKRLSLDRLLGCDINWASYVAHKARRSLEDVYFYSGWLRCGGTKAMHLPERVVRKFSHTHSTTHFPTEFAVTVTAPAIALITASVQFANFRDRVLTTS